MDEKYEHFRRQARGCIEMADVARSAEMRTDWLTLAGRWLEMIPPEAQTAEVDDASPPVGSPR